MRAGPLRHRCTLMAEVDVERRGGGLETVWQELANGLVWAEVAIPTGRIVPVADQVEAVVSAEIRLRFRADVVAGVRIVQKVRGVTKTFRVEAALPDNDTSMLRLLCSSVTNP